MQEGKKEFVSNMGQLRRRGLVVMKGVLNTSSMKGFVSSMVHRGQGRLVAIKDVQSMFRREDYAKDIIQLVVRVRLNIGGGITVAKKGVLAKRIRRDMRRRLVAMKDA